MKDLINTWGLYPWFNEDGGELIHPEDIRQFTPNNTKVFHCIGLEDEYMILQSATAQFRVNPENYKRLNVPLYRFRDQIVTNDQERIGEIHEIEWHYRDKEFIYYISVEGVNKTRRYKEHELKRYE
ncbi:DUF6960 family protein [Cohnella terricola]|uniref:Uncharacterized protein n=1 Tax=Cohnella terricola TaxID=1289167 RepID=A0A559J8T1_9BACL|nr:hypothetical protein [Cohnella terricola]TVX96272.1 hypothetical protein FPZ45_21440 [Cohnella terricola]